MISPKVTRFFGLGTSRGSCVEAMLDVDSGLQFVTDVVRLGDIRYERSRWPTHKQMFERVVKLQQGGMCKDKGGTSPDAGNDGCGEMVTQDRDTYRLDNTVWKVW